MGTKGKQREAVGARGWALGAQPAPPWVQEGLAAEMCRHVPSWRNTRQRLQKPSRSSRGCSITFPAQPATSVVDLANNAVQSHAPCSHRLVHTRAPVHMQLWAHTHAPTLAHGSHHGMGLHGPQTPCAIQVRNGTSWTGPPGVKRVYLECRWVEGLVWEAECGSEMGQTQEGLTLSVEYLRGVNTALSTGDTEADENIMALLTRGPHAPGKMALDMVPKDHAAVPGSSPTAFTAPLTGRAGLPFTCQHSTLTTFGRKNTLFLKTKMDKETCFIQACFKK